MDDLTPELYKELRRIASSHLRAERPDHTLQPTALVHEAYLKLSAGAERTFTDQVHFLSTASRVMRQVLVDYARARASQKRSKVEIENSKGVDPLDVIELDSALQALAEENESIARMVEMRFFGGMTAEETAEALQISVHVVRHDLRYAQAWLKRKLAR
ncbi:MAG: sigma-70 family RNA polymerase sigma factor [Acidobacteria bacterium]|nr:sigma-70 family RNA polymerase sigma factor [Acidobacteriota bacterium]